MDADERGREVNAITVTSLSFTTTYIADNPQLFQGENMIIITKLL